MQKHVFFSVIFSLTLVMLATLAPVSASPAVVIRSVNCSILDADGNSIDVEASGRQVTTSSTNNNGVLVCKFNVDAPGVAVHWDAYHAFPGDDGNNPTSCINDDASLITLNWKETISASGQGTLTCHFKE